MYDPYIKTFAILLLAACCWSCEKTFPPLGIEQRQSVPAAISSIQQSVLTNGVDITVKTEDAASLVQIELFDQNNIKVALSESVRTQNAYFTLLTYKTAPLKEAMTYRVALRYLDARGDTISCERVFAAREARGWIAFPHAPVVSGDFTGGAVFSKALGVEFSMLRYATSEEWDVMRISSGNKEWQVTSASTLIPRHNMIAFPLYEPNGNELIYHGFGYLVDEKLPTKKAFLSDLWWAPSIYVFGSNAKFFVPQYEGASGIMAFFSHKDKVYLLQEDYSGTMRSIATNWDQAQLTAFPEPTGKLAAFTIDSTGYVVNQLTGKPPRLYAYDIAQNKWTRKADFPGSVRTEGIAFAVGGKGFFGLGVNDNDGLRDIWQYDPASDSWSFHSDYPGQGHRLVIAVSNGSKAYLGLGYESRQISETNAYQQVGCTDFWEFKP